MMGCGEGKVAHPAAVPRGCREPQGRTVQAELNELVAHKTPLSQTWPKDLVLIFPVLPICDSCASVSQEAYCVLSQKVQGPFQPGHLDVHSEQRQRGFSLLPNSIFSIVG